MVTKFSIFNVFLFTFFYLIPNIIICQSGSVQSSFIAAGTQGNANLTSYDSLCTNAVMSIVLPVGENVRIDSTSITFDFQSNNNYSPIVQRTSILCQNTGLFTPEYPGSIATQNGVETYVKNNLTIANAVYPGGSTVIYELMPYKIFGFVTCNNDQVITSALITVYYTIYETPKVGVNTTSPVTTLDVAGKLKIADDNTPEVEGALRYQNGVFEGYDGTNWIILNSPSSTIAIDDLTDGKSHGKSVYLGFTAGNSDVTTNLNLYNVGVGFEALKANTTGDNNTANGSQALLENIDGSQNTANGSKALRENINGHQNTANGVQALLANINGSNNTADGYKALLNNTSGNENTAMGSYALFTNNANSGSVAFGYSAMRFADSGSTGVYTFNTAIGYEALRGSNNTGINTGRFNTSLGYQSLYSNTSGSWNTANGGNTLYSNTTGSWNTANGFQSLYYNTTGNYNTANGYRALLENTEGNSNTATGYQSLYSNTTGDYNTAAGFQALRNNTIGNYNTAIGFEALNSIGGGSSNTAIGYRALYNSQSVNWNTAIGYGAGDNNVSGKDILCMGWGSDVSSAALTDATAIGESAMVNANNKVRIGNSSIGVIEGQVAYSYPSDGRFKNNVQQNVPGLDFISKLRPVTYKFDTRKFDEHLMQNYTDSMRLERLAKSDYTESMNIIHSGFIAQEVEGICKELGYDFDGLHVPDVNNKTDNYSIAYSQFIMPLVKAVQELNTENQNLKAKNQEMQTQNKEMQAQNKKMQAKLEDIEKQNKEMMAAFAELKATISLTKINE